MTEQVEEDLAVAIQEEKTTVVTFDDLGAAKSQEISPATEVIEQKGSRTSPFAL